MDFMKKQGKKGYLSVSEKQKTEHLKEAYKGEVQDDEVRFPKKLGVAHPFDFKEMEDLYNSHPLPKGVVDKHIDFVIADFNVKAKDKKSQTLIDSFIKDTNFQVFLRRWLKPALITGNGFAEIDLREQDIRVLDPKTMYVVRDKKGNVKGYNQYLGDMAKFGQNKRNEPIPFRPNQIAHLKFNTLSDEAYGWGTLYPSRIMLDLMIKNELDAQKLVERKAGAPYHVKVGIPGEAVNSEDIDDFNEKLEYLNNRTEWVTDANVQIEKLDFGDLGKNFTSVLEHDFRTLIAGYQVPEVLLGSGQLNEGIGQVQTEGWKRRIKSLQEETEKEMEEKIFRPLLIANGLDSSIEVIWELPSEEEKNKRIEQLSKVLGPTTMISENMRRLVERQLAETLDFEDYEKYLAEPDMELKDPMAEAEMKAEKNAKTNPEREEEETKIEQPEVPGEKPNANEKAGIMCGCGCGQQLEESHTADISVKDWVGLKELKGFNFTDYLANILQRLNTDKFPQLLAVTEKDLELGLLPKKEIEKLRVIMREAFLKNKTIREIQADIERFMALPDRYVEKDGEKVLQAAKESRANAIARTETVRIANRGLLKTYADSGVSKVRFLAAVSERTCPECNLLNGQVFDLKEAQQIIPVHTSCRCTWISVLE